MVNEFFLHNKVEFMNKVLGARLACIKHTASVNPEPGSNSSLKKFYPQLRVVKNLFLIKTSVSLLRSKC